MSRARLIKRHLRHRFVVTLKTGETFDGLLEDIDDSHLVLVGANALNEDPGVRPTPVLGDLWLERAGIAYMQKPPVTQ